MNKLIKKYFQKMQKIFLLSLEENISSDTQNPYIAARREWNFMYSDLIKAKYNWQQIALLIGAMNLALIIGMIFISLQSKFIPYAVKVDSLGNTSFAGYLDKQNEISPSIINAMLRRYITEARSIISDVIAQKHQLDFVYRMTLGEARTQLDNFYRAQNPFETVKSETIDVTINAVLPKSSETWQINWTETHHDLTGHVNAQNHFEALITVAHHTPTHLEDININPLGLFVTHLSWTSQQ